MVSLKISLLKFIIGFVLVCALIHVGQARSTFPNDDDEDQNQLENALYVDHFNGKNPFEDFYYHKKPIATDDVQLAKRIIMLPRVGRRSVRST